MGIRAWWRSVAQTWAKRRYVDACLARMERGRAAVGMPPLTREQRAEMVMRLARLTPTRIVNGRSVWK